MSTPLREAMEAYAKRGCLDSTWGVAPWAIDAGTEMAVTTNGHGLVMVARSRIAGDLPSAPERLIKGVRKWCDAPALATRAVDAAYLCKFVGVDRVADSCETCNNTRTVTCETCDGGGSCECECRCCGDEHTANCDECRGKGSHACPDCDSDSHEQPATFLGGIVNRVKLRYALELVDPVGPVTVEAINIGTPRTGADCFRITGSGWFIVLMGMVNTTAHADFDKPETWAEATSHV